MLQVPRRKGARQLFYAAAVLIILAILAGLGLAVYGLIQAAQSEPVAKSETSDRQRRGTAETEPVLAQPPIGSIVAGQQYIQFTGVEFKNFYDAYEYAFVSPIDTKPLITGTANADAYIQNLAESRGYKLRAEAETNRLRQVFGQQLQPEAREAFLALQEAAQTEEGLEIMLVSGYRSIARQREIFSNSITGVSVVEIAAGEQDDLLNEILDSRSVPGYSKHHTGYTVDIGCGNYLLDDSVAESACFKWLSANNYENAKRFGFLPSYPEGAGNQGPKPEPWEYVWIGQDVLLASQYQ